MDITYTVLVIFGLFAQIRCEGTTIGTTESTIGPTESTIGPTSTIGTTESTIGTTEPIGTTTVPPENTTLIPEFAIPGRYGGFYYDPDVPNPTKTHYIHGTYQIPHTDYYIRNDYYRDRDGSNTLDYYFGYGLTKMTDSNFRYDNFHYYHHDLNRTIGKNEIVPSDFVISCHPNATFLCPENTETICLRNGTIYCMSQLNKVVPCDEIENGTLCIETVVPCVLNCIDIFGDFEPVSLPCLSIVVIEDVNEENGYSLSQVGGTFVVVKAMSEEEKTFCVGVIVDPLPPK